MKQLKNILSRSRWKYLRLNLENILENREKAKWGQRKLSISAPTFCSVGDPKIYKLSEIVQCLSVCCAVEQAGHYVVNLQTQWVVSEKRFENGSNNEGVLVTITWIYPSLRCNTQHCDIPKDGIFQKWWRASHRPIIGNPREDTIPLLNMTK